VSFERVDVDGKDRIEGLVLNGDIVVEFVPSVYVRSGGESTKWSESKICSAAVCIYSRVPGEGTPLLPGVAVCSDGMLGTLNFALAMKVLVYSSV
jgi:hypothetical protein